MHEVMAFHHNEKQSQQNQEWCPSENRARNIKDPNRLWKIDQNFGVSFGEKTCLIEKRRGGT